MYVLMWCESPELRSNRTNLAGHQSVVSFAHLYYGPLWLKADDAAAQVELLYGFHINEPSRIGMQ